MTKVIRNAGVLLLSACLMLSMLLSVIPFSSAASPSEESPDFLTADQYLGLGLTLGQASSCDRNPAAHPLQSVSSYTLCDTVYGWSNPQVLAVMLSSPYWNELNYGADMTAAGSTSFSVQTGVQTSQSGTMNVALGLSFAASITAEVMGNGGEIGAEIKAALNGAIEVQSSKAHSQKLEFVAGAGEDHVALIVFPIASYKYSYKNSNGETEYMVVNVQLEPVHKVTTLANYNRVIREHNTLQEDDALKLPVINMKHIYPRYTTGDPSTAFAEKADFPAALVFENGRLIAADGNASADDLLQGEVFVSDNAYSIGVGNADTGAESSLELSASNGLSSSIGVSLDAAVYGQISEGMDIGIVETSASQRLTLSGSLGISMSHATVNTKSISYAMGYIDLPASAKTGTTSTGIATSDYAFNAKLMVWTPTAVGANVPCAPSIISPLVQFADTEKMPLYLPDDLHVAKAGQTSVTLAWNNPDFSVYPFNKRKPSTYEICTPAQGGDDTTYTVIATVSADEESCTITGLSPDTTYSYCLRAKDDSGRFSAYGPTISATPNRTDGAVITAQPENCTAALGEQALFTVTAEPRSATSTLSYQWYQLEVGRYGAAWVKIDNAESATFNAAYFDPNKVINSSNRFVLDNTIYRCVVVETNGATAIATVSDAVTLQVENVFILKTFADLRDVAISIQKGMKEAAQSHYRLENDITVPEAWNVPIGTKSLPFSGSFDGQGHTIKGLNFDTTGQGYAGLFGYVKSATIQNVTLSDVNIRAIGSYTGAVCGYAENAVISRCTVSGKVAGYSTDSVGGGYAVGGICGQTAGSTKVEMCTNHAAVTGQISYLGGIVAYQSGGTVTDCANHGTLKIYCPVDEDYTTMIAYAGGIVGYGRGAVQNCLNTYTLSYSTIDPQHENIAYGSTVTNSYFLNKASTSGGGKTAEQLASGEVAYLLSGGVTDGTQRWYQNLDNGEQADAYPRVYSNGDDTVYLNDTVYSNTPVSQIIQGAPTTTTTKAPASSSPPTGDPADTLGWWMLLLGGLITASAIIVITKKKTA